LSKWHVCNISGIVKGIKLKRLEKVEGYVEDNQKLVGASRLLKGRMYIILGSANGI
jgi:hypothetical protein